MCSLNAVVGRQDRICQVLLERRALCSHGPFELFHQCYHLVLFVLLRATIGTLAADPCACMRPGGLEIPFLEHCHQGGLLIPAHVSVEVGIGVDVEAISSRQATVGIGIV